VLAVAPLAAAAIGEHDFNFREVQLTYNGAAFTMLGGGIIAMFVGILSYHQMKDRPGVSFWSDIVNAFKGELGSIIVPKTEGLFISFEGGEGSGKSTQSKLLKEWFENEGKSVLLSREPGGTQLGKNLRKILLDNDTGDISPRSEALLYAADRAHHVYSLLRPALERGDVVITDRYFDSSIAYQGAGRILSSSEVSRINRWATESLFPTLTIILDQPAEVGLSRIKNADRLESESIEFHNRVRQEFLELAAMDPERYLVINAQKPIIEIHQEITSRITAITSKKS
jgi:dTMP kinase